MSSATSSLWHRPLSLARARCFHGGVTPHGQVALRGVPSRDPLACIVVGGGDLDALGPAVSALDPTLSGATVVLVRLRQPTPVSADVVHALVDLLRDKAFDTLLTGRSPFVELPEVMARLSDGSLPAICHTIDYDD